MNEKKLVVWYNADFAGCGYLRSIFPSDMLNMKYGSRKLYEGLISSRFLVDKNILSQAKVVHFQRQITPQQISYIEWVDKTRKEDKFQFSLQYDLDDNFANIPQYNFAYNYYTSLPVAEGMKRITSVVDVFTVTTQEMADWVKSYGGSCEVKIIPNYVPKYVYRPYEWEKKKNAKPKVIWAGSPTHFNDDDPGDFKLIHDLVAGTIDDFDWVLVGFKHLPPWIKEFKGKIETRTWYSIFDFPTELKKINADFGVAPLIDNWFNRCKSNIKLLDYYSSDIISFASDCPAYKDTAINFLSPDWKTTRDQMIDIFSSFTKTENMIELQRGVMNKYWMEDNVKVYLDDLFKLSVRE